MKVTFRLVKDEMEKELLSSFSKIGLSIILENFMFENSRANFI